MGAIGNLDAYMKFKTAQSIEKAAENEGGGMAGLGAGLGAGMGIAGMMNQSFQNMNQGTNQQGGNQQGPSAATAAAGNQDERGRDHERRSRSWAS